jgi:hypothetical protein
MDSRQTILFAFGVTPATLILQWSPTAAAFPNGTGRAIAPTGGFPIVFFFAAVPVSVVSSPMPAMAAITSARKRRPKTISVHLTTIFPSVPKRPFDFLAGFLVPGAVVREEVVVGAEPQLALLAGILEDRERLAYRPHTPSPPWTNC